MNRAVFLDRDGTLIRDKHYLHDPSEVEWLPGVKEALHELREAGFHLVVVTNQSGVGRGLFPESKVREVHGHMQSDLRDSHGISFSGLYYATLNPEQTDPPGKKWWRRKPRPGMIERAGRDLNIDCGSSYMVGDKPSDVLAGRRAGCGTVLLTGSRGEPPEGTGADRIVEDLAEAAEWIIGRRPADQRQREAE